MSSFACDALDPNRFGQSQEGDEGGPQDADQRWPAGRVGGQSCREAVTVRPRAEVKFLRAARQFLAVAGTAENFRSWGYSRRNLVWSRTSLISHKETFKAFPTAMDFPVMRR